MKESQFIKENSQKWEPLEKSLSSLKSKRNHKGSRSHQDLGDDFVRVSDDLSYAQTFYRRRSIRIYLNGLASDMYRLVFRYSETDKNPIARFWIQDIPSILYHGRKSFLISFIVFLAACIIGAFSLSQEADFAKEILGSGYVSMTDTNIENNDPMAVYKSMDSWDMFTRIALNNLWVMSFAFLMGLFFAIGTIGALVNNGVMLGVFQYYFYQKGLLWTSFLTIWQHGTVEISCIIIGGGAGIMLGSGLLFPGNYSRLLSLRLQFYRGMKVLLAIAPFIVFAAFVEAYITRHDDMNQGIRLAFIIINAAVIFGYFIYMPFRFGRRYKRVESTPDEKLITNANTVDEKSVLNAGEIFQLAVKKLGSYSTPLFSSVFGISLLTAIYSYVEKDWVVTHASFYLSNSTFYLSEIQRAAAIAVENLFNTFSLMGWSSNVFLAAFLILGIGAVQVAMAARQNKRTLKQVILPGVLHLVTITLFSSASFFGSLFTLVFLLFLWPVASMGLHLVLSGSNNYFRAINQGIKDYFRNLSIVIPWLLILALSIGLLTVLIQSSCVYIILYFVNSFIALDQVGDPAITASILYFFSFSVILLISGMSQLGFGLVSDTTQEKIYARKLREEIANIPPRRNRYGIDETL